MKMRSEVSGADVEGIGQPCNPLVHDGAELAEAVALRHDVASTVVAGERIEEGPRVAVIELGMLRLFPVLHDLHGLSTPDDTALGGLDDDVTSLQVAALGVLQSLDLARTLFRVVLEA